MESLAVLPAPSPRSEKKPKKKPHKKGIRKAIKAELWVDQKKARVKRAIRGLGEQKQGRSVWDIGGAFHQKDSLRSNAVGGSTRRPERSEPRGVSRPGP
jgi:hypothetical protein